MSYIDLNEYMTTETKAQESIWNLNSKCHHLHGSYFVIMKSQRAGLTSTFLKFSDDTERVGVNRGAQNSHFCFSVTRMSKEANFVAVRLESLCTFGANSDPDHHLNCGLCWDRVHWETNFYAIFHLKLLGAQGLLFCREALVCSTSVEGCKQKSVHLVCVSVPYGDLQILCLPRRKPVINDRCKHSFCRKWDWTGNSS